MDFGISVQIEWDLEKESHDAIGPRIEKFRAAFRKAFPKSKLDGFNALQLRSPHESLIEEIIRWMVRQHQALAEP